MWLLKIIRKNVPIILIILLVAGLNSIYIYILLSTPTPTPSPSPTPTPIADDGQSSFWTATVTGSGTVGAPILSDDVTEKKEGADSLRVDVPAGEAAKPQIYHTYDVAQDWSKKDFIIFYFYGNNTGGTAYLVIKDSAGNGREWSFTDNFSAWKKQVFPLRNPDNAPPLAALNDITEIRIWLPKNQQAIWYLDLLFVV